MGTKEEIFNKIGDLLQDLNGQYLTLSEQGNLSGINELVTLEAKAQAVTAYITLLKTKAVLQENQSQRTLSTAALESKKIGFNDYFTPPSTLRASAQQTVAEHQDKAAEEVQPVEDFNRSNEDSIVVNEETIVGDKEAQVVSESEPVESKEPSSAIVEPVVPPVAATPPVFTDAPVDELSGRKENH